MKDLSNKRRDHLANERTFLAWIRTSIGVMAFGFVIEKFSLFLKEIAFFLGKENLQKATNDHSSIFGMILVGIGALIGVLSYIEFLKTEKQIEKNQTHKSNRLTFALTLLIIVMVVFLITFLIGL
ncbi:MAG TPA: DUF202 domain-containing protein [Chlamydiales bacterium]|nr:DUF202 domain-containing protein [Chlamydiales bacterium]